MGLLIPRNANESVSEDSDEAQNTEYGKDTILKKCPAYVPTPAPGGDGLYETVTAM